MGYLKRIFISIILSLSAIFCMALPAQAEENGFITDSNQCIGENQDALDSVVKAVGENESALGMALDLMTDRAVTGCITGSAIDNPGDATAVVVGEAVSLFWGDPIGDLTRAVLEGNAEALQVVMTFWMDFRIDGGTVDTQIQGIKNITWGLSAILLVVSLIIGGGRIAASRRQGLTDETIESGSVIVRYLTFSIAVPAAIPGGLVASDILSEWIMTNFGASDQTQIFQSTTLTESMAGPVIMIALALFALCGSVMQIIALVVRTLLLPLIGGLAPIFAAASFSETGRGAVKAMTSWLIAAIAFKPVASLLYVTAFWTVSGVQNGGVIGVEPGSVYAAILCAILLALAGFTAPSLLRVIAPMVDRAGGGGGAPVLATGAAMAGGAMGLAGGAMSLAGRMSGGSTGSGAAASAGGASTSGGAGTGAASAGGGGGRVSSAASGGSAAQPSGGGSGARSSGGAARTATAGARPAGANPGRSGGWGRGASVQARAAASGLTGSLEQSTPQSPTTTPRSIFDDSVGAVGPYQGHVRR